MLRLGRSLIALLTAYAVVLAPLLGAVALPPNEGLALCVSRDEGSPAAPADDGECCLLGACHAAAPALSSPAGVPLLISARSKALPAMSAPLVLGAEVSLAAPPRGPPSRA
jgi:hypothetical protein